MKEKIECQEGTVIREGRWGSLYIQSGKGARQIPIQFGGPLHREANIGRNEPTGARGASFGGS